MTTGMNLWDSNVWEMVITFSVLLGAMLLANTLRNTVGFIRKMIVPSSVLGGFVLLFVNYISTRTTGKGLYDPATLEILTYHGLGLGFAALSLRGDGGKKSREARVAAFDTGVTVAGGYLLQAAVGLLITIGLFYAIGSFYASGAILPMGYGQGPGQAFTWGHNYEAGGFVHGTSFGLAVAAMGFVSASVGGVLYLNWLKKKGIYQRELGENVQEELTLETFTGENEIPLAESMDKFTVQFGLAFVAYAMAYLCMAGINRLLDPTGVGARGLAGTVQSTIWGFQFLFSSLFGMLLKGVLTKLRSRGVIHREYTNDFLQNRISGFMFDMMVVASIAAIDLSAFENVEFVLPLTLVGVVGAVVTFIYLRFICKHIFADYEHEAFLSLYGMQTGTASTGVILLREVDPQFQSLASDNLVYHMPWVIPFAAPLFLLMSTAAQSVEKSWMTLGVCAAVFVVCNGILFRRQLFRRKDRQ